MNSNTNKYIPEFLKFLIPTSKNETPVAHNVATDESILEAFVELEGIMPGCSIEGDISFDQDAYFNGEVQGSIISNAELVLGENCKVKGSVSGRRVVLSGEIYGDVRSTEILMLEPSAVVHGAILTCKVCLKPGAQINGRFVIDNGLALD